MILALFTVLVSAQNEVAPVADYLTCPFSEANPCVNAPNFVCCVSKDDFRDNLKKASCKPSADCQILWEDTEARESFFSESNSTPSPSPSQQTDSNDESKIFGLSMASLLVLLSLF